jgi:hypothetical protein
MPCARKATIQANHHHRMVLAGNSLKRQCSSKSYFHICHKKNHELRPGSFSKWSGTGLRFTSKLSIAWRATFSTKLRLRCSKWLSASTTRRPIKAKPVMPQRIGVGFLETGNPVILSQGFSCVALRLRFRQRYAMCFSIAFDVRDSVVERRRDGFPLAFIKHRNIHFTAPAVQKFCHFINLFVLLNYFFSSNMCLTVLPFQGHMNIVAWQINPAFVSPNICILIIQFYLNLRTRAFRTCFYFGNLPGCFQCGDYTKTSFFTLEALYKKLLASFVDGNDEIDFILHCGAGTTSVVVFNIAKSA